MLSREILEAVRRIELRNGAEKLSRITVSIGIASAHITQGNQHDDLVGMADKAMLQAKQHGRNRHMIAGM